MGALALSTLLAAAGAPPSSRAPGEPQSLAERIDLTRITVFHADYARAVKQRNTRDLEAYDRDISAMLRDDVLPYAREGSAPSDASAGGTAAAGLGRDGAGTPPVAVDEEEVGAAALDAKVGDFAREFISLEGKTDDASLKRKSSLLGSLQAISSRAQFPGTGPSTMQSREARQRAAKERRERQDLENLPVK